MREDSPNLLDQLRRQLEAAGTVSALKAVHDTAELLVKRAAKAKDFPLLDDSTAVLLFASRKAGALLLAGAERIVGIDFDTWCRRAEMDDDTFAIVLRRAQTVRRRHAGEPVPRHRMRNRIEGSPQTRTLLSPWRMDEFGNAVRYVCGVDLQHYQEMLSAGRDQKKVEAALIRETIRSLPICGLEMRTS